MRRNWGADMLLVLALVAAVPCGTVRAADPAATGPVAPDTKVDRARDVRSRLQALGYVAPVTEDPDPTRKGVTQYDRARAFDGINAYCSAQSPKIHFFDMDGRSIREIDLPKERVGGDCLVEPTPDGGLLALAQPDLWRISAQGTVTPLSDGRHHHDVFAAADGRVYTLSHRGGEIPWREYQLPIRDHAVTVLRADGSVENEFRLSGLFADRIPEQRKAKMAEMLRDGKQEEWAYHWASDVFHANGIEILDRDIGVAPAGAALLSVRELNLIALVDLSKDKVLWSWGPGDLDGPHHPTLLEDGNILVFDNAREKGRSRLVEVNPRTNQIVWEYAPPPDTFYTRYMGSVQPLRNGNRLVTESEKPPSGKRKGGWPVRPPPFFVDGRRAASRRSARHLPCFVARQRLSPWERVPRGSHPGLRKRAFRASCRRSLPRREGRAARRPC